MLGQGPPAVREHRFDSKRRFRFDLAWPEQRVAVEVEGGLRRYGRHNRPEGYASDCEKYNLAQIAGWVVLRYTTEMLKADPQGCVDQVLVALATRTASS